MLSTQININSAEHIFKQNDTIRGTVVLRAANAKSAAVPVSSALVVLEGHMFHRDPASRETVHHTQFMTVLNAATSALPSEVRYGLPVSIPFSFTLPEELEMELTQSKRPSSRPRVLPLMMRLPPLAGDPTQFGMAFKLELTIHMNQFRSSITEPAAVVYVIKVLAAGNGDLMFAERRRIKVAPLYPAISPYTTRSQFHDVDYSGYYNLSTALHTSEASIDASKGLTSNHRLAAAASLGPLAQVEVPVPRPLRTREGKHARYDVEVFVSGPAGTELDRLPEVVSARVKVAQHVLYQESLGYAGATRASQLFSIPASSVSVKLCAALLPGYHSNEGLGARRFVVSINAELLDQLCLVPTFHTQLLLVVYKLHIQLEMAGDVPPAVLSSATSIFSSNLEKSSVSRGTGIGRRLLASTSSASSARAAAAPRPHRVLVAVPLPVVTHWASTPDWAFTDAEVVHGSVILEMPPPYSYGESPFTTMMAMPPMMAMPALLPSVTVLSNGSVRTESGWGGFVPVVL